MKRKTRRQQSTKKNQNRPALSPTRKLGDAYQDAVAQVAKGLDPAAEIDVGVWVNGPDGRRDLDVRVRVKQDQSTLLVVIECKDWTRPVGIGLIDALDSKRRDIGASLAMICSNSGFTADALRKAARVGIPTLAALIEGDNRIRVVVHEQIYTPIVEIVNPNSTWRLNFQDVADDQATLLKDIPIQEYTCEGKPVESWVRRRLAEIAMMALRSHSFVAKIRFREPLPVRARDISVFVEGVEIHSAVTVEWRTQVVEIGASQGMYNYLRKGLLVGPGPGQFHLKNIDTKDWGAHVDTADVPPRWLIPLDKASPDDPYMEMRVTMVKNFPLGDPKDEPDLNQFVERQEIRDEEPSA